MSTTQVKEDAGRFRVLPEVPGHDGFELEFSACGTGEPLLMVHGGLLTGWFDLLSKEAALLERFRLISYHRPGYGRGAIPPAAVSLEAQAQCCLALLDHLGIERAHVLGHSIGGCIALQLALDAPEAVRSLALLEPPVLSAVKDLSVGGRALRESGQRWQDGDRSGAIHTFMEGVVDPGYQEFFEDSWPAGTQELIDGAGAFFITDQPSLQGWKFTASDAGRVTQPVLLVIGDGSDDVTPIRSQVQRSLLEWLPDAEEFVLSNSTHLLPLQNPGGLARALLDFYDRIG